MNIVQVACGVGLFLSLSLPSLFAQTWNVNANGSWSTGSNWSGGTAPNGIGKTATLGSVITGNHTITVDTNVTLGTLTINDNNSYTLSKTTGGPTTLTFNATGTGPAQINILGGGAPTISGNKLSLSLTDATVIDHGGTGLFTISSVIGGAGRLTHNGTGTTLLSGSNTYTGGLTINGGTVRFGNNNANGTGTLTLNGGEIEASGGARTLNEAVTVGGDFSVVGSQALTLSGAMTLGSSQRTVTTSNTALTTFSGVVSGSGGITKAGAGTLTLGGGNTYTGATAVNEGILRARAAGTAFGNNSTVTLANVSGATLDLAGFNTSIGSLAGGGASGGDVTLGAGTLTTGGNNGSTSYAGVISGTGGLTKTGSGIQTLTGTSTYTGITTINAGTLEARNAAALGTTAAGTVVNSGGTLALGGGISITGETLSIAGVGAGGGGALRNVNASNNFNGNITLTANAGIENSVAGTTLTIGNTSFTNWINTTAAGYTATFDGPGDIWLNSAITGTGTLTTTGLGNLVKNGPGTLTFYADENWYTGSTTVNDGALVLDTLTGLNGAIKGTVVNVGDGTGAAGSAILRNGPILSPIANEMINDSATITLRSDGLYNLNTHQETIGALDFTGGEVRTGTGGSLGLAASSPAAAITSQASSTTALIDAAGGDFRLNGSRTFTVADGTAATDLEVRGNLTDGTAASGVTKTGAGRLAFTGTEANTYTGPTTVSGGTLELAKSSGVSSIAGSAITVNTGGTLLLGSSNQIIDSANLTLAGGTLSTGDTVGFSETLGTLTLSGTSSIDLGTAAHMLNFADSSALSGIWSGTLTIYGWTGLPEISGTSGQISFGSTVGGLTSGQLAMISFNGFGPGSMLLTSGELVPVAVPEAEAVVAAALLALLVAWRERRRLGA